MTSFLINQGPFERGFKGKDFFGKRKRMIELSAMQNNGGLKYSKDFEKNHTQKIKEEKKVTNPSKRNFLEILPWSLFVGLLFINIIM